MKTSLQEMAKNAKTATLQLATASKDQKNAFLIALQNNLKQNQDLILKANREDIQAAKQKGLHESLIDRLSLENRLVGIIRDIDKVLDLPDPIGELFEQNTLPNGLTITKCRTPIGVLGIIYESRPNVTIDVSALTIKSGNCAVLRGGSETLATNSALAATVWKSLNEVGLPADAIQFVSDPNRALVQELLRLHESIDLIIPRGNAELHRFCRENSTIPVITGGIGICHLFTDDSADLEKSLQVILNAKTQRPTVCNALDTLLVHTSVASSFIPKVVETLGKKGVAFRLDNPSMELCKGNDLCQQASPKDWDTEWLSLVLGIKIVKNVQEAIDHVRIHSTGHSDGILTSSKQNAELFVKEIDSSVVYVNASTRFTDGSEFGFGAEVAISTQKLHARGPMGLKELTSYKWIVMGNYQTRG